MTRAEYFVRWRASLLELDERTLGVYCMHHVRRWGNWGSDVVQPLAPGTLELWDCLYPSFEPPAAPADGPVAGDPSARVLRRIVEGTEARRAVGSPRHRERYEADVLALGQRARDLLSDEPTAARWNVIEARRHRLEAEWSGASLQAQQAQRAAFVAQEAATRFRARLDAVLAERDAWTRAASANADQTTAAENKT